MVEYPRSDRCTSCGKRLVGTDNTSFPCPKCANVVVGRCMQCKDQSTIYVCKECGFAGP